MEPDTAAATVDAIERAHLREPGDRSHTMHRYPADPDLAELVERFWIPVWSVPPGREAPQRVLQHPACLLVVTGAYARFYGVVSGVSTTVLTGEGWAVGVMTRPAAGMLLTGRGIAEFTDRSVDLGEVLPPACATDLVARVRAAMAVDPRDPAAHGAAVAAYGEVLRAHLPVDAEGRLVNDVVDFVTSRSDVTRVAQVCEAFDLGERSLQRLVARRLGLTPKWLIQRRRLHEAAERLRAGPVHLARVAADLGYADQPHFSRDFARVTGTTPGAFAARYARAPS